MAVKYLFHPFSGLFDFVLVSTVSTPTTAILTEASDFFLTEAGDYLLQE